MNQKKPFPKFLFLFYFLAIAAGIFAFYNLGEIEKAQALLRQVRPIFLLLALGFQALTYFVVGNIYRSLVSFYGDGNKIKKADMFQAVIVALFMTQAIPTGGLSGNGFLFYYFQKKAVSLKNSFKTIFSELFTYYFTHLILLVVLFLYTYTFFRSEVSHSTWMAGILGFWVFLFLSLACFLLGTKKFNSWLKKILLKKGGLGWLARKIIPQLYLEKVDDSEWENPLKTLEKNKIYLFRLAAWQAIVFFLDAATIYVLFISFGSHPNPLAIAFGFMLTKVIAILAVSPGALIFFESALVYFYTTLGIPLETAVIITLLFRALSFWLPMPFGLFLSRRLTKQKV